jgi:hypothetical protein
VDIITAASAGQGFFPLDQQLKVSAGQSENVSRLVVWLSGLVPFGRAAEILERVGQISCSRGTVWEQTQQWGEQFQAIEVELQKQAGAIDMRKGVVPGEAQENKRMGVSMDGGMINIRDEGWKETKIGCVFDVETGLERDERTGEEIEAGCATHLTYVADLGEPETFVQKVWFEAKQRGWTRAADTQVGADGAVWIWNLVQEHFYDSEQVVDWYHGKQHVCHAAEMWHGETTPAMQKWLEEQETRSFQGHADEIAKCIYRPSQDKSCKDELLREAGYFERNHHRMDYLELRIQGWMIGSGMVESGAKQFKARLAGAGMRWSRDGAERLLPIRASILSNRFDQAWATAYSLPQN